MENTVTAETLTCSQCGQLYALGHACPVEPPWSHLIAWATPPMDVRGAIALERIAAALEKLVERSVEQ